MLYVAYNSFAQHVLLLQHRSVKHARLFKWHIARRIMYLISQRIHSKTQLFTSRTDLLDGRAATHLYNINAVFPYKIITKIACYRS